MQGEKVTDIDLCGSDYDNGDFAGFGSEDVDVGNARVKCKEGDSEAVFNFVVRHVH